MSGDLDHDLAARILRDLRRRKTSATGRAIARAVGCHVRKVNETISALRRRGWRIAGVSTGRAGYQLVRSRRAIEATIRELEHRDAEIRATVRALRRGRVPQVTAAVTRRRAA